MNIQKLAARLCAATFAVSAALHAQTQDAPPPVAPPSAASLATERMNKVYLAYMRTTPALDRSANLGLNQLALTLLERTNVEPGGVVGLDITKDDLSLYPVIYWPVPRDVAPLSEEAQKKLQRYIDHGGLIIFDIKNDNDWRTLLGAVKLKPLQQMGKDHTLMRAFYLIAGLPGSRSDKPVFVETAEARNKESVSTVIVGQSDWAGAWAGMTLAEDSRERELALRAGVNMVMMALTGNYKADQVHIPSILERLEPRPQP